LSASVRRKLVNFCQLFLADKISPGVLNFRRSGPTKVNTTPSVAHAPPARLNARPMAQRRAPMVSYTTIDLRDKISCHHGAEDSHTAIECHHERCRNIEGCNLKKDFISHAPVRWGPVAHAPHPLAPQEFRGGGGVWRFSHTCIWWSCHTSFGSTYHRSMTGRSTRRIHADLLYLHPCGKR
jgi:hypothetical protein